MTSDRFEPASLAVPIVGAPLAGGPSTPRLAAAVSAAGGLGTLAAGYLTADAMRGHVESVRASTDRPFAVNVFVPGPRPADPAVVDAYATALRRFAPDGPFGEPRFDDDAYEAKLGVLVAAPVAVVSFTFGCPSPSIVDALHAVGTSTWVTVTSAREAATATEAGVDALVVQGSEAGGHRGSFVDDDDHPLPLHQLLDAVRHAGELPLVAAGGLMTGAQIGSVLAAGAVAAQLGTALLLTPEAATSDVHRAAIAAAGTTTLTRAFSGRLARGIANRWTDELDPIAPSAYPEIHHLTSPLRVRGREIGDPDLVNLWAGTNHEAARAVPVARLIRELADELGVTRPR